MGQLRMWVIATMLGYYRNLLNRGNCPPRLDHQWRSGSKAQRRETIRAWAAEGNNHSCRCHIYPAQFQAALNSLNGEEDIVALVEAGPDIP